jgi:pyruvate formate lyase activating enzyme
MLRLGVWLEVTTLVIPGVNDDSQELSDIAEFLASELGADTPWHIARFFPAYRMADSPPTPAATLRRAQEIGLSAGLRYVYVGNIPDEQNTHCHRCGQLLIRRADHQIVANGLQTDGRCRACGARTAGLLAEEVHAQI